MLKVKLSHSIVFILIFNLIHTFTFGQTDYSNEVYNILFNHNFENNTPGNYLDGEWRSDWNNPSWVDRNVPAEIIEDSESAMGGSKYLRFNFPAGGVGPGQGGGQWLTFIEGGQEELYFSYNLRFKPGFEWVHGGKVPGLRGGPLWNGFDAPPWNGGFAALLMWTGNGKLKFYYYHQDLNHEYGDTKDWEYFFTPGTWYNITQRVVLNTIGANGGNNDGILEGYVNGQLVSQVTGLKFRNISSIKIDQLYLTSFYGGSGAEYAPQNDQYLDLDDFVVFTYQNGVNVVRGNKANTIGTQLIFPFASIFNSIWQKSIKASVVSARSAKISWLDYSAQGTYTLERRREDETNFTAIKQISYGTTSYIDATANPATKYYYRIIINGLYSNEVSVITPPLYIPAIPSGLSASQVNYTSAVVNWTDQSGNETGFDLERSGPNDFTVKKTFSLPANTVSYTDNELIMNSSYQYRVLAKNNDGKSAYSNILEIKTRYIAPPSAPSKLKSTEFTEKSISVTWDDNSNNEDGFLITRSLAAEPTSSVSIEVSANDTAYTDSNLVASTTYMYTVKAINRGGNSSLSNKNVATTLSHAESKRVKDGLVAYYNFGYNPDFIVYDQSGYGDPVNLNILNRSAVVWNKDNTLDILSNTAIVSMAPATKITRAVKRSNELTFECWIKPAEPVFSTDSRIVSLASSDDEVGFLLDQDLSGDPDNETLTYSVRMQTESTNPSGYPEYIPNRTQSYINLQHLVYVRDSLGKETMYLNGAMSAEGFRPSDLGTWKDNYYLRLGNESDMNHSWKGSYYTVAIYNKALSHSEILKNYSVGPCDSIEKGDISYLVEVYPNPISNKATLTITPEQMRVFAPQTTIRIVDIYGNILHQESVFDPNNQFTKLLDFEHYPQGMYFLQVISGKSQKTAKLIVQR